MIVPKQIMPENNTYSFKLYYDWPALENNEIDIKDFAPSILSFWEILEEANKLVNWEKAKITIKVKATVPWSFWLDMMTVQEWVNYVVPLLTSPWMLSFVTWVQLILRLRDLIGVFRKKKEEIDSQLMFEYNDTETIFKIWAIEYKVHKQVWKMYENKKIRKNLESFVKPLENDWFNEIGIEWADFKEIITKEEKDCFLYAPNEIQANESEYIKILTISNLAFEEWNKRKLSDWNNKFFATITDERFLLKISSNAIRFAKDDRIKVKMQEKQFYTDDWLKTEYYITEMIEYTPALNQTGLFTED